MPETRVETQEADLSVVGRVAAARELLRLERRIARHEEALRVLKIHRERLLGLIGGA